MSVLAQMDDEIIAAETGAIRVARRPLPLSPAGALTRAAVDELAGHGFAVTVVMRAGLVTDEGEHAALARLAVRRPALPPLEVHLGLIFGDRTVARVTTMAFRPEAFAAYRELARVRVVGTRLGLPWRRRRRFRYPVPRGWAALEREGVVTWSAPDGEGTIAVYDARPEASTSSADALFEELVRDATFAVAPASRVDVPFTTPRGLSGTVTKLAGSADRVVEVISLRDGQFVYLARLESVAPRLVGHRRMLERIVDATEPIPRGRAPRGALAHWEA